MGMTSSLGPTFSAHWLRVFSDTTEGETAFGDLGSSNALFLGILALQRKVACSAGLQPKIRSVWKMLLLRPVQRGLACVRGVVPENTIPAHLDRDGHLRPTRTSGVRVPPTRRPRPLQRSADPLARARRAVNGYDRTEQDAKRRGRYREEVDRDRVGQMIVQEGTPSLWRRLTMATPAFVHGCLCHFVAKQPEFRPDFLRAPERILPGHGSNQLAHLGVDSRAAGLPGDLPPLYVRGAMSVCNGFLSSSPARWGRRSVAEPVPTGDADAPG